MRRSLDAGERVSNDPAARSICDALQAPTPGILTFAIARRLLAGSLVASDAEVTQAMAAAFADYKLVLEPSGAIALATVLAGRLATSGRTIAVLASGGNVDRDAFLAALTSR
jgi:threonine dehydratase